MNKPATDVQQGFGIDWQRRFTEIFRPPNSEAGGIWEKIKRSSTPEVKFQVVDDSAFANKWFNFQANFVPNNRDSIKGKSQHGCRDQGERTEIAEDSQLFEAADPEDSRYFFWFNGGKPESKEKVPLWGESSNQPRRVTITQTFDKSQFKELSDESLKGLRCNSDERSNLTFSCFVDKESSREFWPINQIDERSLPSNLYDQPKRRVCEIKDIKTKARDDSGDTLLNKRKDSSTLTKIPQSSKYISQ